MFILLRSGIKSLQCKTPSILTSSCILHLRRIQIKSIRSSCNKVKRLEKISVQEIPINCKNPHRAARGISYTFNSKSPNSWKVERDCKVHEEEKESQDDKSSIMEQLKSSRTRHLSYLLPTDYPKSVKPGYDKFALFCFLGNVASTSTMVLSTQTLLLAIGVGTQTAAPISATLNWILKDGIGQFGGIVFASRISANTTYSVDSDPKRWRMVSSLAMDTAMMLELATLAFPAGSSGSFLILASVANIGKNIAFLTASASRAKLHQSLSNTDNLGDITGKATSQSILASLAGTALGIGMSPLVFGDGANLPSVVLGCGFLAVVHQLCTYLSLKYVAINSLNRHRLQILLNLYFKKGRKNICITPEEISQLEAYFPLSKQQDEKWLRIGVGIEDLAPLGPQQLYELHQPDEKFILKCENLDAQSLRICMTFIDGEDMLQSEDMLRSMFQAHCIKAFLDGHIVLEGIIYDEEGIPCAESTMISSDHYMKQHFGHFYEILSRSGWNLKGDVKIESNKAIRLKLN
mmetsp:Transcript_10630/g.16120  ORF Transcript_10630/g.16120 Transcript_10630/m.16120 type:complete len:520 (-) Transcript_10630:296-1855(-)